jgi:hypothetical protein
MQHIDEYTLELYVLGSEQVRAGRADIEAHLERCHGCRASAALMREFYDRTLAELDTPASARPAEDLLPARRRRDLVPFADMGSDASGYEVSTVPPTVAGKIGRYFQRNPMAAGLGSIGLAAALILAALMMSKPVRGTGPKEITDRNPVLPYFNPVTEMFEVLNAEHEQLWQKKSPGLGLDEIREPVLHGAMTAFADLNGDGINEVVTGLAVLGRGTTENVNPLIVWDADGNVTWERRMDAKVDYLARKYSPAFSVQAVVVLDDPGAGGKSILAVANNNGRSPSFVRRYDGKGNLLGTYWHFGVIHAMERRDIDGDGAAEILLCGKNDMDDTTSQEFAFIAALNPYKISGEKRSTPCSGYNLPPSDAELFYVKVPQTDFDIGFGRSSGFKRIFDMDTLHWRFELTCDKIWTFDYVLDHRMNVVEVKSYDQNREVRKQLLAKGKVSGPLDAAYLDRLRQNVWYWDGQAWTQQAVRVRPPAR